MKKTIITEIYGRVCNIGYETDKGFISVKFILEKTEYTISPIKNSEYLVMIQTEGATDGPLPSVCWCDPVDTWLSEGRLSIYNEKDLDSNTIFLVTLMYGELIKLNKKLKLAETVIELGKDLKV